MTDAATGDTFYCRMIAGNICNTPITLFSNKIGITVLPKDPTPEVNITSVPAQPLPGNPVTFTANLTSGTGISYQWQRNGQDVVGATSNTWSTSNLNPYDKISVKAITNKPCPDSSTALSNVIEVNFPNGINDINKTNKLQLFPNPNKGTFTIQPLPASPKGRNWNEDILVEVVNAVGQTVYRQTHTPFEGFFEVSLGSVAAGMYIVKVGGEALRLMVE